VLLAGIAVVLIVATALVTAAIVGGRTPSADQNTPRASVTGPITASQPRQTPSIPADDEEDETQTPQTKRDPQTPSPIQVAAGTADTAPVTCPTPTTSVDDAASLKEALASARPGAVIRLADGVYAGNFIAAVSGTAEFPIWLCGGPQAVIDGGSIEKGYAFHIKNATHQRLVGFTIRGGQKGLMVDGTTGSVIQGLTVSNVGHEGIHLRSATTYTLVRDNTVTDTGLDKEKFGEGIYVGSAQSNWCTYSACEPDRSNNNAIVGNTIRSMTSEAIDIKEGTQNGLIEGNTFDGTGGLTGADSWVDVKGNGWQIIGNKGVNSPVDGFQVHSVSKGWGFGNVFSSNTAEVNGSGFGIHLAPVNDNVVKCSNKSSGAAAGLSNIPCV
jgi:parallel beta-helix repeat protein